MEKYDTLRVEEKPGDLLLATLGRPEVANAFNTRAALDLCGFYPGRRFAGIGCDKRRPQQAGAGSSHQCPRKCPGDGSSIALDCH